MEKLKKPVTEMTDEELDAGIMSVAIDLAKIKEQLERAKSDTVDGIYADPTWYRSATYAQRIKGIIHQQMLKELGRRSRERKQDNAMRFERMFVEEARRILAPEAFQDIRDAAFYAMEMRKNEKEG